MGLMDSFYPNMLRRAATTTQRLTEADLRGAAQTLEEADRWVQLDNNLKYILVNVTTGAAATVCRQHQHEMGLETYRQLNNRFAIPLGTRSIGYLTRLLKPTFDSNNFEESFSNWEFELSRYERDNNTTLPDQIKIAVLMNETSGPLQQHLHLNAGATPTYVEVRETIMEYYRATTALSRLHQQPGSSSVSTHAQGGPAPMDIGAVNKGYKGKCNKGKGKKPNKGKGKSKGNKGKGYGYGYNKGKGKIGQGMPFKGALNKGGYIGKGKGKPTGKGKGVPTQGCYRCGQPGHIARDCRVAVHNLNEATGNTSTYTSQWQEDPTAQWYQQQYYDANGGMMTKDRSAHCRSNNWHYHHQARRNNKFHNFTSQPFQSSTPTSTSRQLSKQQALQKNWMIDSGAAHTFVHHGLLQHTQHTIYTLSKAQDLPQQQKKTSRSTATNGCT